MKIGYKHRLFLYLALLFGIYSLALVLFEQTNSRTARTQALEEKLDTYAEILNSALISNGNETAVIDSLLPHFPTSLRISIINTQGVVIYDNRMRVIDQLGNHALRPEVVQAQQEGKGSDLRTSASDNQTYLYLARHYGSRYVRVALPYNTQVARSLGTDYSFLLFVLLLFLILLAVMNTVINRFGESLEKLRNFALEDPLAKVPEVSFPDDELGVIGGKLADNYRQLHLQREIIENDRKRLLQHVQGSKEGICIFSSAGEVLFFNGLFLHYLNILTDEPTGDPAQVLALPVYRQFDEKESYAECRISAQGKVLSLRVIRFEQGDFEVVINDITAAEQTRLLKQEMTSNIAHELRTPVTSIRGYLETLLVQPNPTPEMARTFLQRAHQQSIALSELIRDIGLITKMEESPQQFNLEEVRLVPLLDELTADLSTILSTAGMNVTVSLPEHLSLKGNRNLLYSIFRNLIDNSSKYSGGTEIHIKLYADDTDYLYLSFSDNGMGISEESHLHRLFDRFYRISEGRTRDSGGSGLGLSIVKNAVAFHRGTISVKNRVGGGLEFLFSLHK